MTYQDIVNIIRNAANYVNPNGFFIHGRKTDGSLNYNEATPQILLLEPQPNTANNNSSFIETITFPIVFVTQDSPESTELSREDLKQEMYLLSRRLLAKIDEQSLLQNVTFTGGQPEIRQLSATLTGFSYSLQITYPLSECSLDFDLPPSIKLFATQTTVSSGATVQIGWIADNVNSVNITPFGVLQGQFGFVNTIVNATTTYTGSATNDNGTATDSITITVGSACLDATAVLKDSANNTLSTTDIPSGDTEDIIAPDGTLQIFNTVPTLIQTETVRSGQTKSGTIADVSWTDSDGSPESTPYGNPIVCTPTSVLNVDFSVDDTTPDTNQTVTFTDLTVGATQWLWSFGDGFSSTLQNPTHSYKLAGVYSVTLCATDGTASGKVIKTNYITVTLQAIQGTVQEYYEAGVGASPANMTLVGGLVSVLNGSVNGFDVSSPVGNRPAYLANQLNGYGCIEFDGINNYLRRLDAAMVRGATATIQMVMKRLELGTNNDHFSCSGASNNTHIVYLDSARCMNSFNGGPASQNYQSPMNEVMIVTIQIDGVNSFIRFGDTPPLYFITNGTNTSSGVVISANASLTGFPFWCLFDKIIFSTPLTSGQIANNVERFKSKFDI
jgi:PKD repeat protein